MTAPIENDPLMTLVQIAEYSQTGPGEVRRDMKRTSKDPRFLAGMLHRGKLKARRSEVNAWIERTKKPAQ